MSNLLHLSFQFNMNWALRSSMDFELGNKKDTQKLLKAGRYKENIPHVTFDGVNGQVRIRVSGNNLANS